MAIKINKDGTEEVIQSEELNDASTYSSEEINSYKKSIKLLSEEEYNHLSSDEKELYIPYQPSMSDKAIAAMVRQANTNLKILSKMMPAYDNMVLVPNPLPTEKIESLMTSIDKMTSLLDPIKKLCGTPIIGQLARPFVNLMNAVFLIIGQMLYLIFALGKGQKFFMDSVTETYDQIDWKGIEEAFREKNKTTESVENMDINWDLIPNNDIKKQVQTFQNDNESISSLVSVSNVALKTQDKVSELTLKQHTWDFYYEKLMASMNKLGVDISLLDKPTEKEQEQFDKLFPNPRVMAEKLSSGINKMVEKQYISIEDNEKLKSMNS